MVKRGKAAKKKKGLPSRDELLKFIAEQPGNPGKREIARAFGITGNARMDLKKLIKELKDEGLIEGHRRRLSQPGTLPPVTVLSVIERDSDGELIAIAERWDEEEHGPSPKVLILPDNKGRQAPGIGDHVLARISSTKGEEGIAYAGKVIKILDKKPNDVLGIFRTFKDGGRIEPIDRKQRELSVEKGDAGRARDGDLVSVRVIRGGRFGSTRAEVIERIGSMDSEHAISTIAIHDHRLPHKFSDAVLSEATSAVPAGMENREDWRHIPLITIDPADAKDHDDAVHAEPDPDPANPGGVIVIVAIADVACYVRPGSLLDREAMHRGNSVYFPDRVVPMLPEALSNDLCSLRDNEDRPALAVRMVFNKDGRKTGHRFHRIMMRSAAKLAYQQAQQAIEGQTDSHTEMILDTILKPLWQAYGVVDKGRQAREPLDLDLPERKIILSDDGRVDSIVVPERLAAHKLIEEFMIQANVAAAETLEEARTPLLYRIHDTPSYEKLEALREFLATLEINFAKSGSVRPSQFNGILRRVADTEHTHLVNEVVLRSQAQAEYNPNNIGHFGLNLRRYAHFTSPIRRYADLLVHRGLIRALSLGNDGLQPGIETSMELIGTEISAAERRAMAAERDTVDRLMALWLNDRVGARFTGRIGGVTKVGLFVRLDHTGADGFIPISTLGKDFFIYDDVKHRLIGEKSGETHRLGDQVEVRLVEASPFAGALRFEMLTEGRREKPIPRRGGRRAQSKSRGPRGGRNKKRS